ncbi:MAG: hypothetical protein ABI629_17045 [bacterium]
MQYLEIQSAEQVVTAIPIVGTILKVMEIAATLAAIAETVVEVLGSQALTENDITLSFDMALTIEHDPDDFRFPLEADAYEVTVSVDKSVTFPASGAISAGMTAPLAVTLQNIPSGGRLSVEVVLKNSMGWIAATASLGPLPATPESAGAITLAVKNRLVPLTAQTQYQHDLELEFQDGAHVWVQPSQPPTATRAALSCSENDMLCQLSQISISPRTGMLGYAWRTGGLGVGQCGGGPDDVFYSFQNVFASPPPDSGLKFAGCGFTLPAALVYDPQGPPTGAGNNFYVEPAADGDGYIVRSVVLDQSTPLDLAQTSNWGRFTQALDSFAVHPGG